MLNDPPAAGAPWPAPQACRVTLGPPGSAKGAGLKTVLTWECVMTTLKVSAALLAATLLAACASGPRMSDAERLALYRDHAGEPVGSFTLFGRLTGWNPLGDSALVVWPRQNQAFLLELHGPCHNLEYATAIGLTSNVGRVHARFDRVLVRGGGTGGVSVPCIIREIRPLDVQELRDAQQQIREQADIEERQEGQEGLPEDEGG